ADPKLFRQCSAMGGTSTAEEHERELTRVVTALNGHQADLVRHARIDHLVEARRSGRYAQTETVRESGDRRFSSSDVQPQRSVGEVLGVEVAEQHIRVGHRRGIAAPAVASRSGLGPAPPRAPPAPSSHAMLPPPAPIVLQSTIGVRTGNGPIRPSLVITGRPPCTTLTSLLVPPMSSEMKSVIPDCSAAHCAPTTPPAGPDRKSVTGCCAATAAETMPPRERMICGTAPTPSTFNVSASPTR